MHASLGFACGARGVQDCCEVICLCCLRLWRFAGFQGVHPGNQAGLRRAQTLFRNEHWHSDVGIAGQIIGVGRDNQVLQLGSDEVTELLVDFLTNQCRDGAAVGKIVHQFIRHVHRTDWNDNGISAQYRVVANDELRAVLHVQQYPVSLAHSAFVLQISGQRVDFLAQLRIADLIVVEDQCCFIRIAQSRNVEVVAERGFRHCQMARQVFGPVIQVSLLCH
jgi:hypothetical protein